MKKILIIGAGVIGSLYAAKLVRAHEDVTVLARGKRLTQLQQHGIVFQDAFTKKQITVKVQTTKTLSPDDDYDIVAIHVRANQLETVIPMLSANKRIATYIFMVNYPQGFAAIAKHIGKERVVIGFPGAGGMVTKDGVLIASVAPGFAQPTTFGELSDEKTQRIQELMHIYRHAGFPTAFSSNMDAWLKTHVVWTLPLECMLYQYDYQCLTIAHNNEALTTITLGIKEGMAVLKNLHIPIVPLQVKVLFDTAPFFICRQILKAWFSSKNAEVYTAQHTRNAPDEAHFLAQEFTKLIDESSIATPNLYRIYSYIPTQ